MLAKNQRRKPLFQFVLGAHHNLQGSDAIVVVGLIVAVTHTA